MNNPIGIFFTTATILNWNTLLGDDSYKNIIISSLQNLKNQQLLTVFAYVIMPNHMHIIWSENEHDRKESIQTSFFKYTAHQFIQKLRSENPNLLKKFYVNKSDRKYQFWQKNTLDIEIFSEKMFDQKLNYLHNNPLQEKWQIVDDPVKYRYSSASFYELGIDEFGILTDYYLA